MPRPRKPKPKTHARAWHAGSIREVRPGVWRAWRERIRQPDGTILRPSRTFSGPHAEAQAATWAAGEQEPDVMLLGVWLSRWLALRRPSLSPGTYRLYERAVLECAPLAGRPIAALTVEDWQRLTNRLLGRLTRSTVAVWRRHLTTALRAAMPDYLTTNTLARVILPARQEEPPKAWTQAEIDRLLAVSSGTTHEPWLLFSLGTGVRLGEARALLWEDVDLQTRTATIRATLDDRTNQRGPTKTRRIRVIDLPDEVVPVLVAHRARQRPRQLLVFGHPAAYDTSALRKWLTRRCVEAGIRPLPPHALRHSFASLAIDAGVPIPDIAHQLGHSVAVCQATYAHFIGQGQRRAVSALGSALRHRFSGPKRELDTQNGTRVGG